jgi:hypothetical protein
MTGRRFRLTATESPSQTLLDMAGAIPMDIVERYFVAAAATMLVVLIGLGFLSFI